MMGTRSSPARRPRSGSGAGAFCLGARCLLALAPAGALVLAGVLAPRPAPAQRAAENVVRSVDDAFGASVGEERIGLYSPGSVRGFSPTAAGNVRIEGIFIDRQADFSSRLVSGSTIRAGLTAQGYLLPAPTGIADFALRRVAATPTQSVIVRLNEWGGYGFAADLQSRTAHDKVEITGGVGYDWFERGDGSADAFANAGTTLRVRPRADLGITVFGDLVSTLRNQVSLRYRPGGAYEPPEVPRRRFVGQPWVNFEGTAYNTGLIADYTPSVVNAQVGVFRSSNDRNTQTGQFFTEITRDGLGRRLAFLGPPREAVSDSLEARVSRLFTSGSRQHSLTLNVRARQRQRRFGGSTEIDLGVGPIDQPAPVEQPDVEFGPRSEEQVNQVTGGFSYDLQWRSVGQLNLGIQKTNYERRLQDPVDGPLISTADPVLYNANAAAELRPWLVAYGGVVTGFEESPTAPAIAINRNEAPPAIETRQADAGLRFRAGPLTAVTGVFSIEKPFFGLDEDRFFGERGTITNRGIELSLAGAITRQLQLVFGTLLLDATLAGDAVDEGELSADPVGVLRRTTTIDLDYRPVWAPGWSFDMSLNSRGKENGDTMGELVIAPRTLLDLGFRRQLALAGKTMVVRGRLTNLFDTFGWRVNDNGDFQLTNPRAFSLSVRMDL
jgi:iron complex outermembrane receptor protein